MPRRKKVLQRLTAADLAGIRNVARRALGMADILQCDLKDVEQDLAFRLILAVRRFRPSKSTWSTYRGTVLNQELNRIIRDRLRPSARYMRTAQVSLDESFSGPGGEDSEDFATWAELINEDGLLTDGTEKNEIPNMNLQIDMADFLHGLDPHLRKICISLQSRNVSETARYLRLSSRSIHRRIETIRDLMIEAGFETYIYPQNVAL